MKKLLGILLTIIALLSAGCVKDGAKTADNPTFFDGAYAMNETFTLATIEITVTGTALSPIPAPAGKRAVEALVRYSLDATLTLGNVAGKTADGKTLAVLTAGAQDSMSFREDERAFATFAVPEDRNEFLMVFTVGQASAGVRVTL